MSIRHGILGVMLLSLVLAGCSDSTRPGDDPPDLARIDPVGESFLLKSLSFDTPTGGLGLVALLGSNLRSGGNDSLLIDIELRNDGSETIFAPARVLITEIDPATVSILNADTPQDGIPGFDYAPQMIDGRLSPGESTTAKTWIFHDPDMAAFAFDAVFESSAAPGTAWISGQFHPVSGTGDIHGPFDPGFPGLTVTITRPDSLDLIVYPDPEGYYQAQVHMAGLYTVHAYNLSMAPCSSEIVGTNPLYVVITENPDSTLNGYGGADFDLLNPCVQPIPSVIPTGLTPEDLSMSHWSFIDGELRGPSLHLEVGYSGCQPIHDFRLYFSGGFMESNPVQATLVLVHDNLELCDAWFTGSYDFELGPLIDLYREAYSDGDRILLQLIDFTGQQHPFELLLFPDTIDPGVADFD